ncbi:MAG TPA: PxKF domain-containing protein [Egicoccus sp.]|nr:PxKF domain-containing protein [Egicoccus sp.]HSK23739.1 PxKF domain-containing protein [Egicoccus sp.]
MGLLLAGALIAVASPGAAISQEVEAETSFARVDALVFGEGENSASPAVIDPAGSFAYFGSGEGGAPRVVKVDLDSFAVADVLTLRDERADLGAAVIHPDGTHAYFAAHQLLFAVDLTSFAVQGVVAIPEMIYPRTAVIDPAGEFAYFGTNDWDARVVKVDLATLTHVGSIEFEPGESRLFASVIDPEGRYAYFGTNAEPGYIVRIDLENFTRAGALATLDVAWLTAAALAPDGATAYFTSSASGLLEVDLTAFTVGRYTGLSSPELPVFGTPETVVVDPGGSYAYVGTFADPAQIVQVDLAGFAPVDAIMLETDESWLWSAVMEPAGTFAYFGSGMFPGRVVKVATGFTPAATYQFVGFERPVENPPVVNRANAGQTIPLKWRLLDHDGVPVTDLESVQVTTTRMPDDPDATVEPIEEYAAGESGLQNLGDGYYQFNWKTPRTYAGSSYTLTLDLGDAGSHHALFEFPR